MFAEEHDIEFCQLAIERHRVLERVKQLDWGPIAVPVYVTPEALEEPQEQAQLLTGFGPTHKIL